MSLTVLRSAAFFSVGTALITGGYAFGSEDPRYVVLALLLALQAMILVYRAAAVQGVGSDDLTGFAERALGADTLSWLTLAVALVTVVWAWRSGVTDLALLGYLLSGHGAFFAHYTRRSEAQCRLAAARGDGHV